MQYTQAGHCLEPLSSLSVAASVEAVALAAAMAVVETPPQVCESEHDRSMGEPSGSTVADDDDDRLLLPVDLSCSGVTAAVVVAAAAP